MSIPTACLANVAICYRKNDVNLCIYINDQEVQKEQEHLIAVLTWREISLGSVISEEVSPNSAEMFEQDRML